MSNKYCTLLFLSMFLIAGSLSAQGVRDRLEGLVYEAEDWTSPKGAWLVDQTRSNRWRLWTREEDGLNKRSGGQSLTTPHIITDRKTPEEGAPVLHTKITGIPNGQYQVFLGPTNRTLALSFDGKKWIQSETMETNLGYFDITDGTFSIMVDDRYANKKNPGCSYYDYFRFVKRETEPKLYDIAAFTLPDGQTQISWISSEPVNPSIVSYGSSESDVQEVLETETDARNHCVVLPNLKKGEKYIVQIKSPRNLRGDLLSVQPLTIIAGERPQPQASQAKRIRLRIDEPTRVARRNGPVTSGVPFSPGVLASAKDIRLVNEQGTELPAQFEAQYFWPDGSVKWLTCDFAVDTQPNKPIFLYLETAKSPKAIAKNSKMEDKAHRLLAESLSKIELEDGTVLTSRIEKGQIESSGPLRVSLRAQGDYCKANGEPCFRWRCHVTVFAGGENRIRWYIGNNQAHSVLTSIRSAVWSLKETPFKGKIQLSDGTQAESSLEVLQDLEKHVSIRADQKTTDQERSDGCFRCGDSVIGIRDFAKTWPKGFQIRENNIQFGILPELPKKNYPPENWETLDETFMHFYWFRNGCYLFKRGMELGSEIWLVSNAKEKTSEWSDWLANPLFAVADPEYYCETGAFGNILPAKPDQFPKYEQAFEKSFQNLEKGRQSRGEFGWMNFGDWFGERTWNWGNNEYDLSYVTATHFARSGRLDYLARGIEMARHYTTIDFIAYPWTNLRELVYAHSTGHIGGFISEDDPRLKTQNKFVANLNGGLDGSGGHAHHPGNYLIGCLTGEKRLCEVAEIASWNQAKRYTPNYRISIERAAGWALANAVYSYQYTNNPYYLNAAKIFVEVIRSTQNPKTGCFDLRQDLSECDCPDKKEHRGGKAFAVGVLMHSLCRYYEVTHDPDVKTTIVRCADWLLDYSWNEEKMGFRYKTGCPQYAQSGWYSIIVTEGIAYASELTGNPRYIDFLKRTVPPKLYGITNDGRGSGKSFAQQFRHLPHLLYYLQKHGISNL